MNLPWLQIERSTFEKSEELARLTGMPQQFALGCILNLWRYASSLVDMRAQSPGTFQVDDVDDFLSHATGIKATPVPTPLQHQNDTGSTPQATPLATALMKIGLIELGPNSIRVRGLSRYFEAEHKRSVREEKNADKCRKYREKLKNASQADTKTTPGRDTIPTPGRDTTATETREEKKRQEKTRLKKEEEEEEKLPPPPQKPEVQAVAQPEQPPLPKAGASKSLDFWLWVQSLRDGAGLIREKPPNDRALQSFYSEALMELEGEEDPLRDAIFKFSKDVFWQQKTPPLPFQAFMKNWRNYVPQQETRSA